MTSINCPWCGKDIALVWIALRHNTNYGSDDFVTIEKNQPIFYQTRECNWSIGACPNCSNCVLVKLDGDKLSIFPNPLPYPTDKRIPEVIRADINEAKVCLSVNAFRACATMCRRAIQNICIDQGIKENLTLESQIDELAKNGIIVEKMRKWAHSVRWVGNDAAHPNKEKVTEDDAKSILSLVEQLAHVLYVVEELSKEVNKNHAKR